jgi:hypothetical protein
MTILAAVDCLLDSVSLAATPITSTGFKLTTLPGLAGAADSGGAGGKLPGAWASKAPEAASPQRPNTTGLSETADLPELPGFLMPEIMKKQ